MAAGGARQSTHCGRGAPARFDLRRCLRAGVAAARQLGCAARAAGAEPHPAPERRRGCLPELRRRGSRRQSGASPRQRRLGRCRASATHTRVCARSVRRGARGRSRARRRGSTDRARLSSGECLGHPLGRLARRLPAGASTASLERTRARLVEPPELRDRESAAVSLSPAAHAARERGYDCGEHAASRVVLPLARGSLCDQGAKARLHTDAHSAAAARAPLGARRTGRAEHVSAIVDIYTDGACRGNPGPGGWAALLSVSGREKELSGAENPTTNNRMELQAVIGALQALKRPVAARLYTDSQYVRRGVLEWLPQWKARGWKTADRKPVKNQDLWQQLEAAAAQHRIEWHWVPGHAGVPGNERCDALANAAIDGLL